MKRVLFIIALLCLPLFHNADASHKDKCKFKKYKERHALGLKRDPKEHRKFLMQAQRSHFTEMEEALIPAAADISPLVSPPENQGNCGSCWDFSLSKALRSSFMVGGKDPGQLEFNYLLNNCGPGPRMYGCGGGDFDAAQSFLNGHGPGLNKDNPYTEQDGGRCKNLPRAATAISYTMLGNGNGPSFKDLAYAVGVLKQALSIDVAVVGRWDSYAAGIYENCQGSERDINHMINMVGYDCETSKNTDGSCKFDTKGFPINGDGYIKVMNNWGTNWGENGYMRTRLMHNGSKCNAVATTALMFTVDAPVPPAPTPTPVPPPGPDPVAIPLFVYIIGGVLGLAVVVLVLILVIKK